MEPYLYTTRGGISIINLEKTRGALTQAASFVRDTVAGGGNVLFVGTKRQARDIVRTAAQTAAMPYVVDRWIGGLFTNFSHVRQLIHKLATLKEQRAAGQLGKYTKKEQLDFEREITRLDILVGGLGALDRLPAAIIVVDIKHEQTAFREAKLMKVPIVALCDSNVNPAGVDYCVPANDDATKSIHYIMNVFVEAIQNGRVEQDRRLAAEAKAAADAAAQAEAEMEPEPIVNITDIPAEALDPTE
jgi:small subunit ribosomal protein S2